MIGVTTIWQAWVDSAIVLPSCVRLGAISFLLGVSAAACSPDQAKDLTQLNTAELKEMLPGSEMSNVVAVHDVGVRKFECDGAWSVAGGRARAFGRYAVENDQYCINRDDGRSLGCYRLYRDQNGSVFQQAAPSDKSGTQPFTPINLRRFASCTTL